MNEAIEFFSRLFVLGFLILGMLVFVVAIIIGASTFWRKFVIKNE